MSLNGTCGRTVKPAFGVSRYLWRDTYNLPVAKAIPRVGKVDV